MRDQEILGLYQAYQQIYSQPQELTEEVEAWVNALVEEGYDLSEYNWGDMCEMYMTETRRDPRGRPAFVYGGRGTPSPDPEGDDNVSRMERAQRRVKRTQDRDRGMAADALFTKYSARQTGRGGENPSPSDRTQQGHPHSPRRGGRSGRGAETDRGGGHAAERRMRREDFDLFDTILEYLVAEGYAETPEAAEVIMVNMSEDWRYSIVEEVLDEELSGAREERAKELMRAARPHGRRRASTDARWNALHRVLNARQGSIPQGRQPEHNIRGDEKLPTKRGGRGIRGRAKTYTDAGSTPSGQGNKGKRRRGIPVDDTREET